MELIDFYFFRIYSLCNPQIFSEMSFSYCEIDSGSCLSEIQLRE